MVKARTKTFHRREIKVLRQKVCKKSYHQSKHAIWKRRVQILLEFEDYKEILELGTSSSYMPWAGVGMNEDQNVISSFSASNDPHSNAADGNSATGANQEPQRIHKFDAEWVCQCGVLHKNNFMSSLRYGRQIDMGCGVAATLSKFLPLFDIFFIIMVHRLAVVITAP